MQMSKTRICIAARLSGEMQERLSLRNSGLDIYCLLHCTVSSKGKSQIFHQFPLNPPSFAPLFQFLGCHLLFSNPEEKLLGLHALS